MHAILEIIGGQKMVTSSLSNNLPWIFEFSRNLVKNVNLSGTTRVNTVSSKFSVQLIRSISDLISQIAIKISIFFYYWLLRYYLDIFNIESYQYQYFDTSRNIQTQIKKLWKHKFHDRWSWARTLQIVSKNWPG